MKNVRQEKLNKMRQANLTQQIAAIEWLDRNRATLKGKAYEPMFLLINIKDQNYAKYVESLIPYRELTSMFLFENSEDLALFYKQSFKNVNSGLVPNKAMSAYRPRLDINDLKAHGFTTYIREQIDAPEDVLLYLCAFHQIHSIPIGSAATHKNIANILNQMPDITRCYTHTHSYSVSKSRYGGHLSTQSSDINSQSYWLSNSVDQSQIKHKESDLAQIQANLEAIDEKARNAKETLLDIERRKIDLNNKMNNAKERRLYIESLANKLKIKMTHLKTLQSQSVDLTAEAKKKLQKLNDLVKKKVKVVCDCVQQASDLVGLNKDKINAVYHHTVLQAEKSRIQELERGYISKLQELQSNHENFEENLNAASDLAKQAMKEANKINNLECTKLPDEYKRVFHTLPDTVDKLEVEITQAEAIQQCSSSVDEQVVRDFEQRAKHIERLQADVAKKRDKLLNHQDTYETTKNEWMQQVEEMIQAINDKFSGLFRQLKCAGEVSLGRPDNLEDFGRYGICIKVSFRQDEQMQELSAWLQSGGEKSVSTMMYMIALQEMTKCPFRVVDEINQGMDPINERKVFDIIVQNSCAKQFAQYFLLTPKLLPDLSFDERTNVICVFNGPHNLKHTSFDFRKFIKRRKALNE
jgi:chromosome segregation ATPase